MPKQTDETRDYPRLPFDPTPPRELFERALRGVEEDPAAAMREIVGIFVQHLSLQQRNNEFSARMWGKSDVAEKASEHWNYVRNGDFVLGTNGDYKWVNNAGVTRAITTTGLPYGVRRALVLGNGVGAKNWIQQSVSATGATYYNMDGWARVTTGSRCGFEVVENSGSTPSRTHARRFPGDAVWQRLGDHRNPGGLTFKTYRGTTRLTVRCVLSSSNAAEFAEVALEKGRRRHPWRHHFLDRGNYVTSAKTAGSASFSGNLVFSASGGAAIRQAATKKFVWGAPTVSAATPLPVSATGTVGTSVLYARQGHVHPGTRSLRTAGSASFNGRLQLSSSGGAAIRQIAPDKFVFGAPKVATATPTDVSTSGAVGTSLLYARQDMRHKGVKGIKYGSTTNAGTVSFSGSGAGGALAWTGGKLKLGWPKPGTGTPNAVSTSGTVGTAVTWRRSDARLRGVKAIRVRGAQGSTGGTVRFSQSSNVTLRRSGQTVIVGATGGGSGTPGGADSNVQFNNATAFGGDNNFVYDDTNKRVGIGLASPTPTYQLQVKNAIADATQPADLGIILESSQVTARRGGYYFGGSDDFVVGAHSDHPLNIVQANLPKIRLNADDTMDFLVDGVTIVAKMLTAPSWVFGGSAHVADFSPRAEIIKTSSGTSTRALALTNAAGAAATGVSLDFVPNTNIALARIEALRTLSTGETSLVFSTYTGSGSLVTEQARLEEDGRFFVGGSGASAKIQAREGTLGQEVLRLESTATNDDPNYFVKQGRAATTNATVTTLLTIAISASNTYFIEARVVARRTGGAGGTAEDGAAYVVRAAYTTIAGVVTAISTVDAEFTRENQAGWDATLTISGTDVLVRVTGAAQNSVTWHCTAIVSNVGS